MKCQSQSGFVCGGAPRPARMPRVGLRCDESTAESVERLAAGIHAILLLKAQAEARAECWEEMFRWAIGDGPLPVDEEAEIAAWAYLRAIADSHGPRVVAAYHARVARILTMRCPDDWTEPTMLWSDVVVRLEWAAKKRLAVRATKAALRALVADKVDVAVRNLVGALETIGVDVERGNALWRIEDKGEDALFAWIRTQTVGPRKAA